MRTAGREGDAKPASLDSTCTVCRKRCRPLRCCKCRQVRYCSVTCQRAHWKSGHRSKCAVPSPQDAWQELQQELIQLTPEEAHQRYQMVQEEIKRLDLKSQPAKGTEQPRRRESGIVKKEPPGERSAAKKVKDDTAQPAPVSRNTTENTTLLSQEESARRDWVYVVEEMPNISSYQVTLWPKDPAETESHSDTLALSMQVDSHGNTNVSLRLQGKIIFLAQFPGRLVATPESRDVVQRQSDCLSLRLQCQDSIGEYPCDNSTTSLASICSIRCRYCEHSLLTETCNIHKVLPLPSGNWDEVTEYLICYNGQPAVDFSSASTSAQEGLALEDSSVIVLHCNSVGNNVCVLAIEGYGVVDTEDDPGKNDDSATFRGPRTWRDSVGGATLCCSHCCATLGFASLASPETFRMLKHRLSADDDVQWESSYTCPSFVAHEMMRYAESKAIYTFVLAERSEGMAKEHRKCLLLKLVSWDTRRAKSRESSAFERNSQVDLLNFQKVLKVIYEVVDDRNTMMHDGGDVMNWTWGGVDLCCLPGASRRQESQSDEGASSKKARASSVRLWLSPEEWGDLLQSLVASSKSFSKTVTEATIIVKLGFPTKKHDDDTIGLSALPLL